MMERTGMLAAPAAYIAACTVLTLISTFAAARIRPSLVSRSPHEMRPRMPETVAVAAYESQVLAWLPAGTED
jgi:hypothetical protein